MRLSVILVSFGSVLIACSSSSSSDDATGGSAGTEDTSGERVIPFNACNLLTAADAQTVIGYPVGACREEVSGSSSRYVWESPPVEHIGSVNVTVNERGTTFHNRTLLCGAMNVDCLELPGVGDAALLNLGYTALTVQKGDAVFLTQCEGADQILAAEDAQLQARLMAENKQPVLNLRGDDAGWRKAASCSLALAKMVIAKL